MVNLPKLIHSALVEPPSSRTGALQALPEEHQEHALEQMLQVWGNEMRSFMALFESAPEAVKPLLAELYMLTDGEIDRLSPESEALMNLPESSIWFRRFESWLKKGISVRQETIGRAIARGEKILADESDDRLS